MPDPVGEIMVRINKPRQQIVNKLLAIGAVEDRKLLRKPRSRKKPAAPGLSDDEGEAVHIGANNGKKQISSLRIRSYPFHLSVYRFT